MQSVFGSEMANVLPSSSSLNDAPPPSLAKFACFFVQDDHAERVEWFAFDVSDDPMLNQTLPLRYEKNHRLPSPSFHEDDESESKLYLKPIATVSHDQCWDFMWAILDNYLYRFLGYDHHITQEFGGDLVERICIKKTLSNTSPDSASKWEPVVSMPTFVITAHALVLAGKLYCLGGGSQGPWAAAYDPDKAVWESLPDPPRRPFSVRTIFSASIEKSTLVGGPCVVIGSPDDGQLQIYNLDTETWCTQSFDTNGSSIARCDLVGNGGHPLAVDDKLYWYSVRSGGILCAYDLLTKVWSMAYFPIHDHEEYFSIFEPHFPPYLAHLGSDKFCMFWVSLLPLQPRDDDDFSFPNPEDDITRLHCLKFQVTTTAADLRRNSKGFIPMDVSFMSCQSHLVSGGKDFLGAFGVDGYLGSHSSDVRCPIPDTFESSEAPGLTVTMQEEMAVEVQGMKRNLNEYGVGSEPSSSKRYSSAPSHEKVRVLKNQVEALRDVCQTQEEQIRAYAEQLENSSKLIDDQAKEIEQLKAFVHAHMQGGRVVESSSQ